MNNVVISNFKVFLEEQHYSKGTIAGYIRAVKDLDDPPSSPALLIEYIDKALSSKKATVSDPCFKTERTALNRLYSWLSGIELKHARKQAGILETKSCILKQYRDYCCSFLHLTQAVTDASVREVKLFTLYISDDIDSINWGSVTADDVVCFLSEARANLRISSLGITVTAIRRFYRFLQYMDMDVHPSVLILPLSTPDWGKNSYLPTVLSETDYIKLENIEFPDTAVGNRDRAVLLCFMELGLRCSEVSKLLLSDIKWNRGAIVISKTKNHCERELPLSVKLGKALEKYVIYHRPDNGEQLFFQSSRFGNKPVTTETVRSIVRRIYAKSNISGWWIGTHTLRRTVGSRLHNAGNGLKSVSDLLGHASINTSKAYVRVDVKALKSIAGAWPGKEVL